MAKKTLIDDLLDAIQAICFYLPLWAVFLVALVPAIVAFFIVALFMAPYIKLFGEGASVFPFYAAVLSYLLSLAAGLSGWKGRQSRKNLVKQTHSIADLRSLSWREFEMMVGEFYRQKGYDIAETKGGADGGIDLDGTDPNGQRIIIQCKHWKNAKIGIRVVRETFGVLCKLGAAKAIVIGTGDFTNDAHIFAKGEAIELIDGNQLTRMLNGIEIHSQPTSTEADSNESNRATTEPHQPSPPEAFMPPPQIKTCPQCGGNLVERVAKRGANTGNRFWGCSSFPKCRYTA